MVNNIEKEIKGNFIATEENRNAGSRLTVQDFTSPQPPPQTSCNMTKGGLPRGLIWDKVAVELTRFIEKKRVDRDKDIRLSVSRILEEKNHNTQQ